MNTAVKIQHKAKKREFLKTKGGLVKKIVIISMILLSLTLLFGAGIQNQTHLSYNNPTRVVATDLFISEYMEGTGYYKAIEIFNGTGQAVDLSNYTLKLASNGGTWNATTALTLSGTLENNSTYVIAHTQAPAAVLAIANISAAVINHNGDDCYGLFHGTELIDVFGTYNLDPGTGWAVAGIVNVTVDHTLIRKPTIISPTVDWALSAGTNADDSQWLIMGVNNFDNLGQHNFTPSAPTAVSAPTFNPLAGTFNQAIEVSLSCATEGSVIYYTIDGTEPSDHTDLYTDPIEISETTTIRAIAYREGMDPSSIATALYTINLPINVATIADLRAQVADNSTAYKLTGEAVITFLQTYRNQKYIQDATAGVLVDDIANVLATQYNVLDGITGITGKLTEYGGMLQFTPIFAGLPATSVNNTVSPITVTVPQFNTSFETYESRLIKLVNVQILETGTFANGTVYHVVSGQDTLKFRATFYDVDYIGTEIPTGTVTLVGIPNSRVDGNYFTVRALSDISTSSTQTFTLTAGWNMISANVVPSNLNMNTIFSPLQTNGTLISVVSQAGTFIRKLGSTWNNGIGNLNPTQGYRVRVNAATSLQMQGQSVALPMTINLNSGWNIISYPYTIEQNPLTLLTSLTSTNTLITVVNESGSFIRKLGSTWNNGIGNFKPGKAYAVRVNQDCTLIFNP